MTRIRPIILAIAIAASLSAPAVAPAAAGIARVAWLQGCWELASPQRTVEEHWMAPRGKTMIGSGRTEPDALVAWIEGTSKGQPRRVEFPYARAACPGK